jgi:hypothetical protein
LRRRAAVAIVLATASALLACNAILGNSDGTYVPPTEGGVGDVSPTDSGPDVQSSSDGGGDSSTPDVDAAAADGPRGTGRRQLLLDVVAEVMAGYVLCTDFGSDPNASPSSFVTGGDSVTDGQAALSLTAETSVSPPLSMLATTNATDAAALQSLVTEPLVANDGSYAIPSYIAFDLLVSSKCQAAPGGNGIETFVVYKLGTSGIYAEIDLTLTSTGYNLYTSTATADAGILYPRAFPFSVNSIPFGTWAAIRLDFGPIDAGAATVTLSVNESQLGSVTLSTKGESTPPFDPTVGEVHLGISTFDDTPECTAYYDNFVIGSLLR